MFYYRITRNFSRCSYNGDGRSKVRTDISSASGVNNSTSSRDLRGPFETAREAFKEGYAQWKLAELECSADVTIFDVENNSWADIRNRNFKDMNWHTTTPEYLKFMMYDDDDNE